MNGQKPFIPFNGIARQYKTLEYELREAVHAVMLSGWLLNDSRKATFEDKMASRLGREYAICVNSGTNALHYIFDWIAYNTTIKRASGWQPTIAVPNYSFRATINSIAERGTPKFVDVDEHTGLMDLKDNAFSMLLDVIMYVNLYGNMINYEELVTVTQLFASVNRKSIIIEDAAQSFGATYKGKPSGSFGDFSILSFDPTKNFGSSTGGGGMILTNDHSAASWFFNYLSNGMNHYNINAGVPAVNSSMSEVDCAGMLVKLKYFDKWQERRTEIAEYYNDNLDDSIITPRHTTTKGVKHAYSKYVILSNRRENIRQCLKQANIETKIHYQVLEPFMPVTDMNNNSNGAMLMSNNVLSLPIYPELTDAEVERIVEEVNKACEKDVKLLRPMTERSG